MIPDLRKLRWIKSSHSGGNGGQCLEAAIDGETTFVKDSKNTVVDFTTVLRFSRGSWMAFLADAKAGRLG
jgi:hypothetical protein